MPVPVRYAKGMTNLHLLALIAFAMFLGALIGFERELADKPAGLRTHMLVAGGATLLVSLGDPLINFFAMEGSDVLRADPIRLIEAVITGISFLGAGTILRRKDSAEVEGLTTAASLLFVAVVGICVALSELTLAVGATLLALLTLSGVKRIEQWLERRRQDRT